MFQHHFHGHIPDTSAAFRRGELERARSEYLKAELPNKEVHVLELSDLSERSLSNGKLPKPLTKAIELLEDDRNAVVLVASPVEVSRYRRALEFLQGSSHPENLYGLFYSEVGGLQLHHTQTEAFVGYRDVRISDGTTRASEHHAPASKDELGYEFTSTQFNFDLIADRTSLAQARNWRDYLPVLPLSKISVDAGEMATPVFLLPALAKQLGVDTVYVKDESRNFTRSFKDRQTYVLINKAVEDGCKAVSINSSGNAAIAAAAYAKRAGIECIAVVPTDTTKTKQALLQEFGATVHVREGNYEENHRWLIENAFDARNITPGATGVGLDGIKLIAYELVSQGVHSDVIVAPSGNGSLVAGLYKGYQELKELGFIDTIPKIVSVQMKDAAPLRLALESGTWLHRAEGIPDSEAEAIIAEESFSSPVAIEALRATGGSVVEVTDSELEEWQTRLRREYSVVSEYSSAAAFAALDKLELKPGTSVTVINTAGGDKDLLSQLEAKDAIMQRLEEPKPVTALQMRRLETTEEFAGCEHLQRQAFGFEEREIVSREMLGIIQEKGGLVIGAFQGDELVAFSSALLARDNRGIYLHSDLAAVSPELQSGGIGFRLKMAQRELALSMGIDRICWTYDPMLTKNANLNIKKLGGRGVEFSRDVYGQSSSTLYAGLPTHRLLIEWDLTRELSISESAPESNVFLKSVAG
ncbi:MAG: pyridoxal-phosphate dependent enzyme, partial [Bdellovibrionales bacterium]|nr:pyridoxal-phosphate dependent enzyme [Bdellovibrionales bacterium]